MKKKNGLFLGVAALVALCVVYIAVGQYMDRSEKRDKEQKEAERVYMTDISDITGISYEHEGAALSFTKKGDTWQYDGDDQFPVLQSKVAKIADTAGKLEAIRTLEGGDAASYGFETPSRTVEVTGENGAKMVIVMGAATEDGDYYAKVEGRDMPYLIGGTLFTDTSYGLDDLIQLESFPSVKGEDVKEITITKDGTTQSYRKNKLDDEAGTVEWYKEGSGSEEEKLEDNSALNVLADSLASLTVKKCADYKVTDEKLSAYGLDDPGITLGYVYDDNGTEGTLTLSVGSLNEDSSYYTRMNDSKMVNEIDKASIDKCLTVDSGVKDAADAG